MASKCPKCNRVLEEDAVCCADVRYTWKCRECRKLSQGFVVPYGKCYLCGGTFDVVEDYDGEQIASLELIRDAVQMEVDMYHFYRLATAKMGAGDRREVLEDLYAREQDHLDELRSKYHLDLDDKVLTPGPAVESVVDHELFSGIQIDSSDRVRSIYEKALELERRTHSFFAERAESLPAGTEKELCRELAAEEAEHVALLESELQHL